MQWSYQTKKYDLSESFTEYIESKLAKLDPFLADKAITGEIMLKRNEKAIKTKMNACQITITVGDVFLRAEEKSATMRAAFDICQEKIIRQVKRCLLYTSPSPRDRTRSRMPSSA